MNNHNLDAAGFLSLRGAGRAPEPGESASLDERNALIQGLYENLLGEDAQRLVDLLRPAWERAREYHRAAAEVRRRDEDLRNARKAFLEEFGRLPEPSPEDRAAEKVYWERRAGTGRNTPSEAATRANQALLSWIQVQLLDLDRAWLDARSSEEG